MIWSFATRYLIARKSTQAINIISWVSITAIAVGASALIIVLSVFNGFEDLVKSLYSSFYPEIKVSPERGKTMLVDPSRLDSLRALYGVGTVSEVLEEKGVLQYNGERVIAVMKGVDSAYARVTGLPRRIIRGSFATGSDTLPQAVLGTGIEAALGVDVQRDFIPLVLYLPNAAAQSFTTAGQAFHVGQLHPAGTFAIQQDFDNQYVITSLDYLRSLMGLSPQTVSGLEIALQPGADPDRAKTAIRALMGPGCLVQDRYEQNRSLYGIMQTEKWAVYAILCFIFVVAAFNMIGSLSMLVIEKRRDISILKAMGAAPALVQRIFLAEGLLIAASGALAGTLFAVLICMGQQRFGWVRLGAGTFVVDQYPVSMKAGDFLLVWVTIVVIALAAAWYPARRAARQPVDLKAE